MGLQNGNFLRTSLKTPAAWHGTDLANSENWIITLTPAQSAELTAAGSNASWATNQDTPYSVTRSDFPLPTLNHVCDDIAHRLEGGPGIVLLRGFPVTKHADQDLELLLWGFGTHLGAAEKQDRDGLLLHRVQDTGRDINDSNVRYFQTSRDLTFHNDGADAFMLLCVRTADHGGKSRIVSSVAAFNRIVDEAPDLALVLQQPFHFDLRGQQEDGSPPYQSVPVFNFYRGRLCTLYKRQYIDSAQRFEEVPPLTAEQRSALDLMDAVCADLAFEFEMRPGEVLFANNYDVLHARSAFADSKTVSSRLMLRLWLSLPNCRALPPTFAATREFQHSYARHRKWEEAANQRTLTP